MAPKAQKTTSTTPAAKKPSTAAAGKPSSSSSSAASRPVAGSSTKKAAGGAATAATKKPAATSSAKATKTTTTTSKKHTAPGAHAADMDKFRRAGGTDMEMAEGGEMNSDAIVSAGGARGGDDEPDELEEEEEVAPVEMGEDPWGAKSREEEWKAIVDEEARKVVVEEEDVDGGSAPAAAVSAVVDAKLTASFAGEPPTPRAVVATDCSLSEFSMSAEARAVVVSLDLSGSKLSTLATLVGGGWLWVRELKLSGNKIKGWPRGLAAMPALISLDLSFNPISLAGADLRPLAGLVRLELSGCDLTNLTGADDDDDADDDDEDDSSDDGGGGGEGKVGAAAAGPLAHLFAGPPKGSLLTPLVSLVELNLVGGLYTTVGCSRHIALERRLRLTLFTYKVISRFQNSTYCTASYTLTDNDIASIKALAPLKFLPALRDADLNENDVRDVRGYKKAVLEMLPKLTRLDGDGTGQGTQIPRGRLDYSDSGTATVFGANVDRSSCSCVEGNPCVDSTNCLDWKGRYTVAMMVRRRKGYFGEEGTNFQCNIF